MATTTNYGWTTPDDTALVKDGASAIRTLGSSVDTTTKNLNPETTLGDLSFRSSTSNVNTRIPIGSSGQHLTVVAGVPAWATASDQTPLTTKGDLLGFSTLDARIPIGTNNQVLTADSAQALGLKWATPAGGGLVWIGNTSFSASQTINVNNVFSTTYDSYKVIVNATSASSNPLTLRLRVSGTDTSSGYNQQALLSDDTTTTSRRNYTGTDDIQVGDVGADAGSALSFDVVNPFLTAPTFFNIMGMAFFGSTSIIQSLFGAIQSGSTSFTGFTLLSGSNATGTLSVYGYAKA